MLAANEVRIGRGLQNDVILPDHFSSSIHASIYPTEEGYMLEDRGSKNGTFLNGTRITGKTPLASGDEILIGHTVCRYDRGGEAEVTMAGDSTLSHGTSRLFGVRDILQKQLLPNASAPAGNPRMASQSSRERRVITALSEASQALIYPMGLEDLLPRIMDLITQNIVADRCVLLLREKGSEELVPKTVRIKDALLRSQSVTLSRSILKTAIESNSAILFSDIQADRRLNAQQSIVASKIRSAICVPLWNNKEIIGLIYADRVAFFEQYSEEDLQLLTVLANLAAIKIENARLFEASREKEEMERELVMAQKIQMNFLPRTDPLFSPYDISGRTLPCSHVGGDYFDFIQLTDSGLCLVVADVSGHGVSAGLLMTSLRSSLHAMLPAADDLASLAVKLNNTVHSHSDSHSFISFFIGLLRHDDNEISYVNAGHPPPLLLNSDGSVTPLDSNGLCLGMFPGADYRVQTKVMNPDAILCLYTDGIVEQRNRYDEEFGESRLIRQLYAFSDLSAKDILDKIYEDVFYFSGGVDITDDLTLVVAKKGRHRTSVDCD
jgi:serine phosphatase RsbU (regulator of sigma subunit)